MKKLLLSVIAFALITLSCNKYKDDFANLNARIDALAAQVQGVAGLSTSIAALQTSITAVQTAVAAIPNNTAAITALQTSLTALTTTVNGINTSLGTVATNVTNLGTSVAALNALITTLSATVASNQTALIAAVNAAQAAIAAAITNNNTALAALIQAQIDALELSVNADIAAAQAAINANTNNQSAILQALIAQLQTSVNIANAQLQTLISSNNVFIGDLNIFDEATLAAAEALGAKVRVITGNVNINTTTLDAGQMVRLNAVTDGVTLAGTPPPDRIFIGTISGNLTVAGPNAVDLGSLVNVSGATGNVTLSDANHDLSALLAVKGNYTVTVSDVMDDALASVGGNLTLNYPAAYSYPNLNTVNGNIVTTDNIWVSNVLFPVLSTIGGSIDGNTPSWASAATINLGAGNLATLTAANAGTIILGEPSYPGAFALSGPWVNSLTMSAVSVNGTLGINIGSSIPGVNPVTTVNINSLTATNGTITITTDASTASTVSLNAYNDNDNIVITGPTVQTLPAYTGASGGLISSTSILTLTLPVYRAITTVDFQFDGLTVLRNLTLGAARARIRTSSFAGDAAASLQTLTVTYAAYALAYQDFVDLNTMANLVSVSVTATGELNGVYLQNDPLLTSVTTAGQMDWFYIDNNDAVGLTLNMGNTAITSANGTGSYTYVTNNANVTSFTTSTSYMKNLIVTGNGNLTAVNFGSYNPGQNITAGLVTAYVYNNKLSATYTASIFAINSAPVISTASGLTTLKAYMTNLYGSVPHTVDLSLGFSNQISGVDNSVALLDADATAFILAGGTALNTFVQRTGDAGGAMGSRVNVLREMNFIQ